MDVRPTAAHAQHAQHPQHPPSTPPAPQYRSTPYSLHGTQGMGRGSMGQHGRAGQGRPGAWGARCRWMTPRPVARGPWAVGHGPWSVARCLLVPVLAGPWAWAWARMLTPFGIAIPPVYNAGIIKPSVEPPLPPCLSSRPHSQPARLSRPNRNKASDLDSTTWPRQDKIREACLPVSGLPRPIIEPPLDTHLQAVVNRIPSIRLVTWDATSAGHRIGLFTRHACSAVCAPPSMQ